MRRDIKLEVVYPYPPERVWHALTDSRVMSEWLMPNDFQPRLGHRFAFQAAKRPGWGETINCEVMEVSEPRRLAYSWQGGPLTRAMVGWTLEPVERGTRLKLDHSGFEGVKGFALSFVVETAWRRMLRGGLSAVLPRLR